MEEEIWKDIKDFEDIYQISSFGRVRSLDRGNRKGKILKLQNKHSGYKGVVLYKDKKGYNKRVHCLVAEAFIENPDNLPFVNHKDENKENNKVSNLEWCTNQYNCNYGTRNERVLNARIKIGYVDQESIGMTREEYIKYYRDKNREKIYEKNKERYHKNKERYLAKKKEYYEAHKEEINRYKREWARKKREKDKQNATK